MAQLSPAIFLARLSMQSWWGWTCRGTGGSSGWMRPSFFFLIRAVAGELREGLLRRMDTRVHQWWRGGDPQQSRRVGGGLSVGAGVGRLVHFFIHCHTERQVAVVEEVKSLR